VADDDIFIERMSAKSPGRPVFNEVIQKAHSKKYDGIASWKLDRLARNPVDGGLINWALQNRDIEIIKTSDRDYHPQDNVLMMSVEFGMANQFVLDLGKNSKRGMDKKAKMGWFPGRAPEGWLNISKKDGSTIIEKDEERFSILQKLGRMKLTHDFSIRKLCKIADEMGYKTKTGKKLGPSVLHHILTNLFTTGDFLYKGVVYKGNHAPMFTYEEYDAIQDLMGAKGRPRGSSMSFAYSGLMVCGKCSHAITAQLKRKRLSNGEIRRYTYYSCAGKANQNGCREKYINEKDLEAQMEQFLSGMEIDKDYVDYCKRNIAEYEEITTGERLVTEKIAKKRLNQTSKQLDALLKMRLNGELESDEYLVEKQKLQIEKKKHERLISRMSKAQDEVMDRVDVALQYVDGLVYRFKNGDPLEKREILSTIGLSFVLMDSKLAIQANELFLPIQINASIIQKEIISLEPSKGLDEANNGASNSICRIWLSLLNDLRTVINSGFWSPLFSKL
jgi:DNA invertase Pin-like site-specific DNA recombinase